MQPLDSCLTRADHVFVDDGGELHGARHYHSVGGDGAENIIHRSDGLYYARIVNRTRQVKENEVQRNTRFCNTRCRVRRIVRLAAHHRIGFLRKTFELLVSLRLIVVVFHRHIHVALAHIMDAVLREVTIDHCDVIPFDVV